MAYNATVEEFKDEQPRGVFVAEVREINGRLQMLRSNSLQCTGYEGKTFREADPERGFKAGDACYDWYLRHHRAGSEFRITVDNCEGYKRRLQGLNLPPAYVDQER